MILDLLLAAFVLQVSQALQVVCPSAGRDVDLPLSEFFDLFAICLTHKTRLLCEAMP
jgi:hypothetical protein